MRTFTRIAAFGAVLAVLLPAVALAQIDARMLRYPDVSATQIAFVYAGDIWIVPKSGGMATRLSSPAGQEISPKFSNDGSRIAYSANYDGNLDVYVVSTMGGDPLRLTYHPMDDRVVDWHPDGHRVLFASGRESGRQRYSQFYLVDVAGGMPEKLKVPYGEYGGYSPDGQQFAYVPQSQAARTWKRYRGGWAPDIWTFNLTTLEASRIAPDEANDEFPMWHGDTIYFLSDRGPGQRSNLWAYDRGRKTARQVTTFTDYDVLQPSIGPGDIVFQAGGGLYLLDLGSERVTEVKIQVVTDKLTMKPRSEKVADLIENVTVSPTGKRGLFEARGDVFTVPAENGPVLNLTRSSGVAERTPRWSPDGKTVAYWSDRSGEYELTLRPADGSGGERTITSLGPGFRYEPFWSPDSKHIAFVDEGMRVRIVDIEKRDVKEIDQSPIWQSEGPLEGFVFSWSPDSRWVAWSRPAQASNNGSIFLYDTKEGKKTQVTTGYFNEYAPTFDPEGKYLYFLSDRNFEPEYSAFDTTWTYANATRIVAVTLRFDVPSPLAPQNDVEGADEKKPDDKAGGEQKKDAAKSGAKAAASDARHDEDAPARPVAVTIDLAGFEQREDILPPKAGNYARLRAVKGKLVYSRLPRTGSGEEKSAIVYFDFDEREEKTVLAEADDYDLSADGKKLLVVHEKKYAVIDLKEKQKIEKPMNTGDLEASVDPAAEWHQMFNDAFRFERDFFYDPNMHGLDWNAVRARYAKLIDQSVTRWDVNFVLGEFIAELNSSHTYRGGGDEQKAQQRGVGMLGVDWEVAGGAYRIKHVIRGGAWDTDTRAALAQPGVNVKDGDYVLAVNGVPLDVKRDPWASFQGLANDTVILTVNSKPTAEGARQVTMKCLDSEEALRFREWIEQRRQRVDEATKGRAGYVYVQSTGVDAQNELVRQYLAQWKKDGLVIDERFNSGGQIPDRFVELLNRPVVSYWATRYGEPTQWPPAAHRGPKVMLINGWSGSGGDAFPFYFREEKVGPLIGTRTWGGLIGVSGSPSLVDGGGLTVPTFRMYDVNGKWFAEGHGVEPDIPVDEDPSQLARGTDPQLERAIEEILARLKDFKPAPGRPAPERRTAPTPTPSAQEAARPGGR